MIFSSSEVIRGEVVEVAYRAENPVLDDREDGVGDSCALAEPKVAPMLVGAGADERGDLVDDVDDVPVVGFRDVDRRVERERVDMMMLKKVQPNNLLLRPVPS